MVMSSFIYTQKNTVEFPFRVYHREEEIVYPLNKDFVIKSFVVYVLLVDFQITLCLKNLSRPDTTPGSYT